SPARPRADPRPPPNRERRAVGRAADPVHVRTRDLSGADGPAPERPAAIGPDAAGMGPPVRHGRASGSVCVRRRRARQRSELRHRRQRMTFIESDTSHATSVTEQPRAEARGRPGPSSWTILAYLAGDNDLEGALLGDLREMERVGSRPGSVEILARVDR